MTNYIYLANAWRARDQHVFPLGDNIKQLSVAGAHVQGAPTLRIDCCEQNKKHTREALQRLGFDMLSLAIIINVASVTAVYVGSNDTREIPMIDNVHL